MQRRRLVVLTVLVVGAIAVAGWRSVFVGGWHDSGDRSPWHTLLHPLPPDAFGEMLPGLPEACNRDARQVTFGWAAVVFVTVAGGAAVVWRGSKRPTVVARSDSDGSEVR